MNGFIPVHYHNPGVEFKLNETPGNVVVGINLHVRIKKIPMPTLANEGYWIDLVHSSYISALSMVGKKLWQRANPG